MKKLSSMLALSLALAMVLGMTAFAYVSPEPPDVKPEVVTPGVTQSEVDFSKLSEDAKKDLAEWLEGGVLFDIINRETGEVINQVGRAIEMVSDVFELTGEPVNGTVTLKIDGITVESAKTYGYLAMHLEGDVWVPYDTYVDDAGNLVIVGLDSFSPFIIVAYDNSDGAVPPYVPDAPNQKPNEGPQKQDPAPAPAAPGTSPKTGESTSMAMLIVLVSLAGASVLGAKKAFSAR